MPSSQTELLEEQQLVEAAYARLEEMTKRARAVADQAMANRASAGPERDAIVESGLRRVAQLSIGDEALVFGRIDNEDNHTHHIGRVAVYDADHEPMVTDWRAPAAEPFYRATPAEPLGVVRRRHILSRGREVLHIEDELLEAGAERADDLVLVGEAALLDALRRERSGRMRDIVQTIQREQDEIIRAPLEGMLVVQGGPGTGKTAVALHRAAYLLYTHRDRLSRTGVLVVGPSAVFLRYIEQVLPSLGESATLGSIGELVSGTAPTAHDTPGVARIKGDPRMAKVIERGVRQLQRGLAEVAIIPFEGTKLRLTPRASKHIVKLIREKIRGMHNDKRPDVFGLTVEFLYKRWTNQNSEWGSILTSEEHRDAFEDAMRAEPALRAALDEMWPVVSAPDLVELLLTNRGPLRSASDNLLSKQEQDTLLNTERTGISEHDVALIDEALPHLGPPSRRRKRRPKLDAEERFSIERLVDDLQELNPIIRSERKAFVDRLVAQRLELEEDADDHKRPPREWFGHVVIDEAQSLSPMQWRMIGRRSPSRSMTVVGDLGQNTGAAGASSWNDVVEQLKPPTSKIAELSINYRSPEPVAALASRVLAEAAPTLRPPRSVRQDGDPPVFERVEAGDLAERTAKLASSEAERASGTVAIVAPDALVADLRHAVGIADSTDAASLLDSRIAVLDVDDARGLEFDSVIVVEPAAIAQSSEVGLHALYIALTRATQRLIVVHAQDLPAALRS